jgi:hypothetical protein
LKRSILCRHSLAFHSMHREFAKTVTNRQENT